MTLIIQSGLTEGTTGLTPITGLSYPTGLTEGSSVAPVIPFVPNQIANLALWLDASDAASITSSSNAVSQWNDKSGLGNHATQAIGLKQPSTGLTTLNGLNAIDFNGMTGSMTLNSAMAFDAVTILCSMQVITSGSIKNILCSNNTIGGAVFGFTNALIMQWNRLAAGLQIASTNPYFTTEIAVASGRAGLDGYNIQKNGVVDGTTATANAFTAGFLILGNDANGSSAYDGAFNEIIVYNRQLTNAEMNLAGTYLATKMGKTWTAM